MLGPDPLDRRFGDCHAPDRLLPGGLDGTGNDMDLEAHRQALRERDAAWSATASSGADLDEILDFWTDDAVVIPPGMPPVVGKDALRAYVAGSLAIPGFRISWTTDSVDVSADASMAWILGTNKVEMTGEDGKPMAIPGRAITVWRRDGEVWRCCGDVWNSA